MNSKLWKVAKVKVEYFRKQFIKYYAIYAFFVIAGLFV